MRSEIVHPWASLYRSLKFSTSCISCFGRYSTQRGELSIFWILSENNCVLPIQTGKKLIKSITQQQIDLVWIYSPYLNSGELQCSVRCKGQELLLPAVPTSTEAVCQFHTCKILIFCASRKVLWNSPSSLTGMLKHLFYSEIKQSSFLEQNVWYLSCIWT